MFFLPKKRLKEVRKVEKYVLDRCTRQQYASVYLVVAPYQKIARVGLQVDYLMQARSQEEGAGGDSPEQFFASPSESSKLPLPEWILVCLAPPPLKKYFASPAESLPHLSTSFGCGLAAVPF